MSTGLVLGVFGLRSVQRIQDVVLALEHIALNCDHGKVMVKKVIRHTN